MTKTGEHFHLPAGRKSAGYEPNYGQTNVICARAQSLMDVDLGIQSNKSRVSLVLSTALISSLQGDFVMILEYRACMCHYSTHISLWYACCSFTTNIKRDAVYIS